MGNTYVSEDYFKTVGMRLQEGRDFSNAYDSASVVFNEAAIKRLRIKNPVGQKIITYDDKQFTIAGW